MFNRPSLAGITVCQRPIASLSLSSLAKSTSIDPVLRWPAIIGIIVASVVVISIVVCCVRCLYCGLSCCCDCFGCFRGRNRKRTKYADTPSPFNPAPFQGYQPANSPHGYQPPQYAHFDANPNGNATGGKMNEDSLPAMPSWDNAPSRKILEENHDNDVEMGKLDPQKEPMMAQQVSAHPAGYSDIDAHLNSLPYQQHGTVSNSSVGNSYGPNSPTYGGAYGHSSPTTPRQYHSPDDFRRHPSPPIQQAYSAYAPSESTRYEPSSVYGAHETGAAYHSQSPYLDQTRCALHAGRRPAEGSWKDI